MKVIQLAHRYEITLLKMHCELYLLKNMDIDHAEECLLLARKLDMDILAFNCLGKFYFNFRMSDLAIKSNEQKIVNTDDMEDIKIIKEVMITDPIDMIEIPELILNGETKFLLRFENITTKNLDVKYGIYNSYGIVNCHSQNIYAFDSHAWMIEENMWEKVPTYSGHFSINVQIIDAGREFSHRFYVYI
ncbi:unnamed protein product [Bursaphelenchus okinawaensis]|uniref:Uncharacterized protein n=1 Tax=Bursaphelenchus okinawaensis TaxID=465554 RepID=A0A811KP81_9BILA|nr:unnamed protein product [Bursaphelenchus okinawaensis]CAG9107161.1 unnamed protein product [Bursaphelenchus okinawaensis]